MPWNTLLDTATLSDHLVDAAVVIVDCRFDLKDNAWGARAYRRRHIRGAVYAHLERDLSGGKTGTNGRHPAPEPAALARTLGRLGIDRSVQVVAYDQDNGMYASRLWWLLRWLGHDAVAVLDGGLAQWEAERRGVVAGEETRAPATFVPETRGDRMVAVGEVERAVASRDRLLVDARAPERYRGEVEPIDRVPGHIPGAVNYFHLWNVTDGGRFRSPEEIRRQFRDSIGEVPADRVISYCGSGVTACHNLLAFEHAGLTGGRLYAGSWSEWSSDPARAVARDRTPRATG